MAVQPGQLLKDARLRHGVTQIGLAARAGTTQSAISRVEKGAISPTVETLRSLLAAVGEELGVGSHERDAGVDRSLLRANLALTPAERVHRGLEFANVVRRNRGAASGVGHRVASSRGGSARQS